MVAPPLPIRSVVGDPSSPRCSQAPALAPSPDRSTLISNADSIRPASLVHMPNRPFDRLCAHTLGAKEMTWTIVKSNGSLAIPLACAK